MAREDWTADTRHDPWENRHRDRQGYATARPPLGPAPLPMWGSLYAGDPYREVYTDPDPYRPGFRGDEDWRRHGTDHRMGRDRDPNERGFLDRAGDEIASWFGDEEAEHRREMDHRGRGPKNFRRSDERIEEEANERLTEDPYLDASDIAVRVKDREITLEGLVDTRNDKRHAEDCVDRILGVEHVQNNLRLRGNQPPLSGLTPKNVAG